MSIWVEILWWVLGSGLVLYVLTGGADLGAGLWSLLATGPRQDEQRKVARQAIAPIWEANHVWLIFVIVVMFTAFPRAFAAISIALHIPVGLALLGLVFRGAAFSFEAYGIQPDRTRARWLRVFSWSSLVTPVFLGVVLGGASSGAIQMQDGQVMSGFLVGWTTAFAWAVGGFSLVLFGLLAAVYLAAETQGELQGDFIRRALWTEVVAGVFAAGVFLLARAQAPELYQGLARSPWTWPVQIGTAVMALATCALLWRKRTKLARLTVAAQVGLVVVGWGLAMDHHFLLPSLSIQNAGANPTVLPAIAMALAIGAVLLVPSLWYLFYVFKLRRQSDGETH